MQALALITFGIVLGVAIVLLIFAAILLHRRWMVQRDVEQIAAQLRCGPSLAPFYNRGGFRP